jgi:23S rRNA (guanosine2251-2'-O)-methyltransferase
MANRRPTRSTTGASKKALQERGMSPAARKYVEAKLDRQRRQSDEGRKQSEAKVRQGRARAAAVKAGPTDRSRPTDRGLGGEQVEGRQAVRELLLAGRRKVYEIAVASDLPDEGVISDILDLARDQRVPVVEVNRKKLESVARSEAPQGVIARAAALPEVEAADLLTSKRAGRPPFLLAVDGVTDPGNLGALLRCADGAGVTGVVLPRHRAVHVTPTAAKAAAGAVEHLRLALVPGIPAFLQRARQAGLWVLGFDDAAERSLFEVGELGRSPVVVVVGAEGAGLSRLSRERCDLLVRIPMLGRLSSLNVSAAGALALYEIARQRQSAAG